MPKLADFEPNRESPQAGLLHGEQIEQPSRTVCRISVAYSCGTDSGQVAAGEGPPLPVLCGEKRGRRVVWSPSPGVSSLQPVLLRRALLPWALYLFAGTALAQGHGEVR